MTPARIRLEDTAHEIMVESAEEGKRVAQDRARYDEGEMHDGIGVVETPDGADLVATDPKTVFHEYGTGVEAGSADADYPGQRGSTGSEAKKIPWVYYSEGYGWVTTYGVRPAPMLRPGYQAGLARFYEEKRRRGL